MRGGRGNVTPFLSEFINTFALVSGLCCSHRCPAQAQRKSGYKSEKKGNGETGINVRVRVRVVDGRSKASHAFGDTERADGQNFATRQSV